MSKIRKYVDIYSPALDSDSGVESIRQERALLLHDGRLYYSYARNEFEWDDWTKVELPSQHWGCDYGDVVDLMVVENSILALTNTGGLLRLHSDGHVSGAGIDMPEDY